MCWTPTRLHIIEETRAGDQCIYTSGWSVKFLEHSKSSKGTRAPKHVATGRMDEVALEEDGKEERRKAHGKKRVECEGRGNDDNVDEAGAEQTTKGTQARRTRGRGRRRRVTWAVEQAALR